MLVQRLWWNCFTIRCLWLSGFQFLGDNKGKWTLWSELPSYSSWLSVVECRRTPHPCQLQESLNNLEVCLTVVYLSQIKFHSVLPIVASLAVLDRVRMCDVCTHATRLFPHPFTSVLLVMESSLTPEMELWSLNHLLRICDVTRTGMETCCIKQSVTPNVEPFLVILVPVNSRLMPLCGIQYNFPSITII